ncbi:hypothetical protein [Leptospira ognonensis]|nr:hypothetical protein [Leptospira ognonensis]
MNQRTTIPADLALELIKTIRVLALAGKKNFNKYLYESLVYGGWERDKAHLATTASRLMDKIQEDLKDPAYEKTIPHQCKRLISQAIAESLSALGDSCIFFLEHIREIPLLAKSEEAREFVFIIERPLKTFAKETAETNEKRFEDSIQTLSLDEMKEAFDTVRLDGTRKKVYLEKTIHNLYQQVLLATKSNNLSRCKKLLSQYILTYHETETYNKAEVETLLNALDKREEGFRKNIWDSLAIEIYYSVTRGILEGNAKKAIQGIRKYAYIFEGDPDSKFYFEIDGLERKLYKIIQDKDMMKNLRKA